MVLIEELISSDDVPLEHQNNFVEMETVLAELTLTTATVGVEDSTAIATSTRPTTYFYSCHDDSYSGSRSNNNNNNNDKAANLSSTMVSSSAVGTNQESFIIAKLLLRFNYDLLIASKLGDEQQQEEEEDIMSMESVYSMVHQFETRLLENVGLELSMNKSLFCKNSGDNVNFVQLESAGDNSPIVSGQERKGVEDGILLRGGGHHLPWDL